MNTQLALIQPTEYQLYSSMAKVASGSGYSKMTEVQAMFVMLKGYELGISPMQSLDGIQVIQGKTMVSPQLMLALINRSGLMDDMKIDPTDQHCVVSMTRKGRTAHVETFALEDAKTMGLAGKDNWVKQPKTMMKWRAVAACARVVFPDVIQGMYTPEELGAEVVEDESGELVIEQIDTGTGEIITQSEPTPPSPPSTPPAAPASAQNAPPAPMAVILPEAAETPHSGQSMLFEDDYSHIVADWPELKSKLLEDYAALRAFYTILGKLELFQNVYERDNSIKKHLPEKEKVTLAYGVYIMLHRKEVKVEGGKAKNESKLSTDELKQETVERALGKTG